MKKELVEGALQSAFMYTDDKRYDIDDWTYIKFHDFNEFGGEDILNYGVTVTMTDLDDDCNIYTAFEKNYRLGYYAFGSVGNLLFDGKRCMDFLIDDIMVDFFGAEKKVYEEYDWEA